MLINRVQPIMPIMDYYPRKDRLLNKLKNKKEKGKIFKEILEKEMERK